jgi:ELWxxDGT repeat protein
MRTRLSFFLTACACAVSANAATNLTSTYRIADLNPGITGSYPSNFTVFHGGLYFTADNVSTGTEMWNYDGRAITLTTNINDQVTDLGGGVFEGYDSLPDWLTPFNGALYFSAFDQRRGGELWRWNGTNATRVSDINADVNDLIKPVPNSAWPYELTPMNGALYFAADNHSFRANYELWKYNGTTVSLLTNIHPDGGSNFGSFPKGLTAFDGSLYFMADDGANGYELWKHNGTNTVMMNLNPGGASSSSYPKYFTPFGAHLYFQAFTDAAGYELWRTDGTNTSLVTNLNASGDSFPEFMTVFQGTLYWRANDGVNGSELWKSDGTNAVLVTNINAFGDAFPKNLTVFGDHLVFAANDGINGWELWRYDGTNAALVTNLNVLGDAFPESLTIFNGALYFTANTPETGYELWKYDGQSVTQVTDINPGSGNSYPLHLHVFGNQLVFSATEDGYSNWEPWTHIIEPLRITSVNYTNTNIALTWNTLGGTTNVLEASEDVEGPYQQLGDPMIVAGEGKVSTNVMIQLPTSMRFFRVTRP